MNSIENRIDLATFSSDDLRQLQESIKQQLKKREVAEMANAREEILAIAQKLGVPLTVLIGGMSSSQKKEKTTVAVQFRNPTDSALQWTGRGRQPKWVKEWIAAGNSLDLIRV